MAKIGIFTCSNTTQDLSCASAGCFASMRGRQGGFERYPKDEPLGIVGIISCANCPTIGGYEKILKRVNSLVEFGVEIIHFSFCIDVLCPFKAKSESVIKERYPDIEIVIGTHASPLTHEQYRAKVHKLLCQPAQTMPDITKGRV